MTILDARLSRPLEGGPSFPLSHRLFRLAWQAVWLAAASWTPPPLRGWRRWLLIRFGADLAAGADVRASARVWYPPNLVMGEWAVIGPGARCYNIAPVRLGRRTIVSQRAHLCTGSHDLADPDFQLVARPITIDDEAWVAAEAFVGPGVSLGRGAVLAARGAAFADLAAWTIYRGNPAQPLRVRPTRDPAPCSQEHAPAKPGEMQETFPPREAYSVWGGSSPRRDDTCTFSGSSSSGSSPV